ncbi:MAG: YbhB/YbcL family Raf kinase inhibitor-like protein [Verrucomicrobiota bacterium]
MVAAVLTALVLTSPSFHDGARIPRTYTCDGRNVSPALRWTTPPRGTRSLGLRVVDVDAHDFLHWDARIVTAAVHGLAAGYKGRAAVERTNSAGTRGYTGPCPPPGSGRHRYVFTLTAFGPGGKALARARLVGVYSR